MRDHKLSCCWYDSGGSRGLYAYVIFLWQDEGLCSFEALRVEPLEGRGGETNHLRYILSPLDPICADTALNRIIWRPLLLFIFWLFKSQMFFCLSDALLSPQRLRWGGLWHLLFVDCGDVEAAKLVLTLIIVSGGQCCNGFALMAKADGMWDAKP